MAANMEISTVATGLENMFSFQSQRRAMPNNVQTVTYLHTHFTWSQSYAQNSPIQASKGHELKLFRCSNWFQKSQRNQRSNCNIHWIIEKAREFKKKCIYFCFTDYSKAFDSVGQNKLEKSSRVGNTRPPCLPSVKPVCRSRSNTQIWTQYRLIPNQERSELRLYIVTLLI